MGFGADAATRLRYLDAGLMHRSANRATTSSLALSHVESATSRLGKVNEELMSTLLSDYLVVNSQN